MFLLNQPFKTLQISRTRLEIPDMHDYSAVHFLSRQSRARRQMPVTIKQGITP
jgi:hypothetical protein